MEKTKYSVKYKNGNDVDKSLYKIDFEKKTFYSKEKNLVIDFSGLDGWTFDTLGNCKFVTGNYCKFVTGNYCKFVTGYYCEFKTGNNCSFVF